MLRRVIPATAATALLLAGVTGCTAQTAESRDCTPVMQPGALSNNIQVEGGFDEAPQIVVPKNISISTSQRTVVDSVDDADVVAGEGSLVGVNMAFFDAASGDEIYKSPAFGTADHPEFLLIDSEQVNPLSEAVRCLAAGERAVLALGPQESMQLSAQLGGTAASLIGVIDVETVADPAVSGKVRGLPNGFPAVVTNDDGRPGIVLPPTSAPEGTTTATRIKGKGPVVTSESNVIAQVLEVGWDGAEKINTWNSGIMPLGTEAQIDQSGYAFRTAVTGATVGSQLVIIENTGNATPSVFVVDVLGVS